MSSTAVLSFFFHNSLHHKRNQMAIISDIPGPHIINGTDYSDSIEANDGDDTVYAKLGDDWVFGGDGNDRIYGGSKSSPTTFDGNDYLDGGAGSDNIYAGSGNDKVFGGTGNDTLDGGDGSDSLLGEDGIDSLDGSFEAEWDKVPDKLPTPSPAARMSMNSTSGIWMSGRTTTFSTSSSRCHSRAHPARRPARSPPAQINAIKSGLPQLASWAASLGGQPAAGDETLGNILSDALQRDRNG
jgi:hypothetical protein